jgi:hypothetical protein
LVKNFSKINVYRTTANTSSAANAKGLVVAVDGIAELVHNPLAKAMQLDWPRIVPADVQGEQTKHAGVPVSNPLASGVLGFVTDIETMAGRT